MKNKIVRLLCLMLALIFLTSGLVACSDEDDGDDVPPQVVTGTGEERFNGVNFNGKTIKICLSRNQDAERSGVSTAKYMNGIEDNDQKNENDPILMAAYNRNEYVKGKLGLNVEYTYLNENTGDLAGAIKTKYDANDGFADCIANMTAGVARVMMMGILANCNRTDVTNYFDFTDKSWFADVLQAYSLGADLKTGKMYILGGDYFIDIIRTLDILFVNESVLQSTNGGEEGVKLFYSIIKGEEEDMPWTYDMMATYASYAYRNTGSEIGHDENDENGIVYSGEFGYTTRLSNMALVYSADIDYLVNNGNGYQFNTIQNLSALTTLRDKVATVLDYGYGSGAADRVKATFLKNKSLFALGLKLYNLESADLSSIKICPIPLPKLNASDEYKAYMHNNASVGAVFKTGDFEAVSAFWQYANIMSQPVREKYYTDGLGLKYDLGSDTRAMLDIIYDAIDVNISFVWENLAKDENSEAQEFTEMFQMMIQNGDQDLAGLWATYETPKRNALNAAMNKFYALN